MAQTGFTPIQLYRTTTASAVPVNTNLADGELAINTTDEKLYFKNASGVVKLLASTAGVGVQSFSAGTTGLTPNTATTGVVTLAGTLAIANGGTGATTLAGASIATYSGTETLTNKRITPRVSTDTSSATPTINTDTTDQFGLTAQAADITSFTTNLSGTPTDGQKLWIYIVGTAARAITWGASFEASTIPLPTTTVSTNRLDVGFVWNAATSKWRCVATA